MTPGIFASAPLSGGTNQRDQTQPVSALAPPWKWGLVDAGSDNGNDVLKSRDGLRLVGCGTGRLSIHVLAPYPGWEQFINQAQQVMRAASSALGDHPISQVTVRYIDQITLPVATGLPFNELLPAMPPKPSGMPEQLSAFRFVFQTIDPEDGCLATMTLASAPSDDEGRLVVLYDLQLRVGGDPCCGTNEAEWLPIVERLHHRQRDIFEGSASMEDEVRAVPLERTLVHTVAGAGMVARLLNGLSAQMMGEPLAQMELQFADPVEDFTWLDDVYSAVATSRPDDAVDLLFDPIDDMLLAGEETRADDLLLTIEVKRLDITAMLAVLAVTRPASVALINRAGFLGRVKRRLQQVAPERMESLLSGLR
ncbi:MAG: TIGR04255 family protein [Oligoflexia bacterium]|nr:TIGR04255 family protein [Oligoflexia bacterium]